jgi:DNA-binding helix-hairpin-helix protein with protein kinase domain
MEPPPNCITLDDLSPEAGELFVKAFAPGAPQNGRPTGEQWAAALDSLSRQLKACSANRAHVFFHRLLRCPWCAIEGRTGILLFLGYAVSYGDAGFNIKACWTQITAVPGPGPGSSPDWRRLIAGIKATRPARVAGWKRKGLIAVLVLVGVAMVVAGLAAGAESAAVVIVYACIAGGAWIFHKIERHIKAPFEDESRACDARLRTVEERWQRETSEELFKTKLKDLKRLFQEYNDLPMRRQQRVRDLERDLYNLQLTRFLERYDIASANILHVKEGRKVMLSSYGIDTAADVNVKDLEAVPGFGHFLTAQMMDWRRSLEGKFRFDSKRGVDPADLRRLDQELGKRRIELELTLSNGRHDLEQTARRIILARGQLWDELEKAHIEAAQAWANLEAA